MTFIATRVDNGVGEIILDRPKALNALDQTMIDDMSAALHRFADDDAVQTVLVTSASERAFCAGGDIRAIRDNSIAGDHAANVKYFSSEYELDLFIAEYPKPYVSIIDGAAMGGGLGISVHGEVRVVGDRALMAMPETAIGFFPDIGATYFLPRLPAGVGMWLGLTGARVKGADAVTVGMATHYVPSDRLAAVADAIRSGAPLLEALGPGIDADAPETTLPLAKVADYFSGYSVPAILGGLRGATGDEWAGEMIGLLGAASPTSLLVTARLLELGATSQLNECFDRELTAAENVTATDDFVEGVRAVLVDKDRNPSFSPDTVEQVDAAVVAALIGEA
ncbi:enoyl-CoA hydratase/isomerase family protein [Williamsia sp. CHRR-6]|uniref:enoyl-CoA hydratase/isomerase family protein n=1 Tax=Williamsia sp. CHRR-6 TaxID=2835871 RepID=UPI001BDA026A|nr:enoyl-CoA hydratase/isomerase family protein [Williamsia sp. CHRR-6]MBT0566664.1 enoyl-CoA hydratase/isomerase family protein [Williamsia sp. CHRR-6]